MNRTDPTFRDAAISEEEMNAFLDELFDELFDNDPINSDSDKIPDLSNFD